MLKKSVTQTDVVKLLNEMLLKDPKCVKKLFEHRVPCNGAISCHPTIQVLILENQDGPLVGLLGILNGLFGIGDDGFGAFAMEIDDDGNILKFLTADELKPKPTYLDSKKRYERVMKKVSPEHQYPMVEMTCYSCKKEHECEFAWDPYNTDGDCLAEK